MAPMPAFLRVKQELIRMAMQHGAELAAAGVPPKRVEIEAPLSTYLTIKVDGELLFEIYAMRGPSDEWTLHDKFLEKVTPIPGFEQWFPENTCESG